MADIVIELLFEELPGGEQIHLRNFFGEHWCVQQPLAKADSKADSKGDYAVYIGARRVALLASGVAAEVAARTERVKGPSININEQGLEKFLTANGLVKADVVVADGYYFYQRQFAARSAGLQASDWLASILADKNLFSQTMVWQEPLDNPAKKAGEGKGQWRAIRPLRQIIIQVDNQPMQGEVCWQGRAMPLADKFVGHRFLGGAPFALTHAAHYLKEMAEHRVMFFFGQEGMKDIAAVDKRMEKILPLAAMKQKKVGFRGVDNNMLQAALFLVEYPFPLLGKIDEQFMTLPPDVIISTLAHHQKFICLYEEGTDKLSAYFAIIANNGNNSSDLKGIKKEEQILAGYQRVLRARLSDAQFFYNEDKKHDLYFFRDKLKKRLFFADLGSIYDKTERIKSIALDYKNYFTTSDGAPLKDDDIKIAAALSKADLTTAMVSELPELQGTMGYYYAHAQGLALNIAAALREHYLPRGLTDSLPPAGLSSLIAFADKLDTLKEFFRINRVPKGSGDPFALRRAALGIIRIFIEQRINIALVDLALADNLAQFMEERFLVYCRDRFNPLLCSIIKKQVRQKPFHQLYGLGESMSRLDLTLLLQCYKRALNITRDQEKNITASMPDEQLLVEPAEKIFYSTLMQLGPLLESTIRAGDWLAAVQHLAAVQQPLNNFFDGVLINADDINLRANRRALVGWFLSLTQLVADFSLT